MLGGELTRSLQSEDPAFRDVAASTTLSEVEGKEGEYKFTVVRDSKGSFSFSPVLYLLSLYMRSRDFTTIDFRQSEEEATSEGKDTCKVEHLVDSQTEVMEDAREFADLRISEEVENFEPHEVMVAFMMEPELGIVSRGIEAPGEVPFLKSWWAMSEARG